MAWLLHMPEVAANATEAVLQEWIVEEGAAFARSDVIATVETEKAVVDIDGGFEGFLLRRLVPDGSSVAVGAPIAVLAEPSEQVGDVDGLLADLGVTADPDDTRAPEPEHPAAPAREPAPANGADVHSRVFVSPLARRLARDAGMAVEQIRGTGPHGRIVRRDVEAAVAARRSAGTDQESDREVGQASQATSTQPPTYTDVEHTSVRRAVAARLTESKQTVPHFYLRATVDVGRLLEVREELNDGAEHTVSVNDLVVKAVACAHTAVPEMNVTWSTDVVRRYSAVDVSIAVDTERGLLTPTLRSVETLSVTALSRAARDLGERAREGRVRQHELEGGTISVSNLGMFGTEEFGAIINPPQAAILAVGAIAREPVARKRRIVARPVMRVTLSVDHRSVDGVVAARWMRAFVGLMEKPLRILA